MEQKLQSQRDQPANLTLPKQFYGRWVDRSGYAALWISPRMMVYGDRPFSAGCFGDLTIKEVNTNQIKFQTSFPNPKTCKEGELTLNENGELTHYHGLGGKYNMRHTQLPPELGKIKLTLNSTQQLDIGGLKLGMNSDATIKYIQSNRSYLRKLGDKNVGDLFQGNDGVTNLSVRYTGGNHGNIQREFLSVIFQSGTYQDYTEEGKNLKSIIIGREVYYKPNKYPHVDTFVSHLIKKYGKPSYGTNVGSGYSRKTRLIWNFNLAGNQVANTKTGPCDPFHQNQQHALKDWEDFVSLPFHTNYENQGKYFLPPKVSHNCGTTLIVVGIYKGGTMGGFTSVLYHQSAIMVDRWKRDMSAINQAKLKTQKAVDRSKSQQLDF